MRTIASALVLLGACTSITTPDDPSTTRQSTSGLTRAGIEICADSTDNDGDGTADEAQCQLSPTSSPTSTGGVVPASWSDNPTCVDMGYGFGIKIDSPGSGTYAFSAASPTGDAPSDPYNSVSLTVTGNTVAWSSSLPVDAVFVKGGTSGNLYAYAQEEDADAGLASVEAATSISHIEFCYDYELTLSKTANASYARNFTWKIDKSVDHSAFSRFMGQWATANYLVQVTRSMEERDYRVAGSIYVTNATPFEATGIAVVDQLGDIGVAVSCPKSTLASNESMACSYSQALDGMIGSLNSATVTTTTPQIGSATATAEFTWGEPTVTGNATVTVWDTSGQSWVVSDSATFAYSRDFGCSTDLYYYAASGAYGYQISNTATIEETGQYDSADVYVDCYAPVVSKNANPSYTRTYNWYIDKSASAEWLRGFAGRTFNYNWNVWLYRQVIDQGFQVHGNIFVTNPSPTESMVVQVIDPGAVLGCEWLEIPANSTRSCDYWVLLDAPTSGVNTATIKLGDASLEASTAYAFGEPTDVVGYPVVHVTDTLMGDLGTAGSDQTTFNYDATYTCPTDASVYSNGEYWSSITNTATITETGQQSSFRVTVNCYQPAHAKVVKATEEGLADIGQLPFVFNLYNPGNALVETKTLDAEGAVNFATEIKAGGTWKVVEVLPAGWDSTTPLTCTFKVAFWDSAGKTYTCNFRNIEKTRFNVAKLTDGVVDPSKAWTFALYNYAGFDGAQLATASTFGDGDGLLTLGDFHGYSSYTLCELNVPAGWSSVWKVDTDYDGVTDTIVVPYNPNADDEVPGDLGNRCIDINASTTPAMHPGEIILVSVDNQYPGGEPRTPGYWKNWNRCTGGGQAANADRNGGWAEGYWLIENVLDPTIGGGIVWDDILVGSKVFTIRLCEVAVDLLDKRAVGKENVLRDGKKMSADAAYNLAANLLAAQLNFAAGAATCPAALEAALAGETLLDEINFVGNGNYLRSGAKFNYANALADTLDDYNNGLLCP